VVKHVGKRRLEAHSDYLRNAEHLSEAEAGRDCAGALQDTNSGVGSEDSFRVARDSGAIET
jgi:hypothetical protein